MRSLLLAASCLALAPACSSLSAAPAEATVGFAVGAPAPEFTLSDLDGATHTLADQRGKVVVLEWFNPGCPFVKAAHGAGGPLAAKAKSFTDQGVVWWAINSGAPGKEGHGVDTNKAAVAEWSMAHPVLIDEDGTVGKAYGAVTTPQMVVIKADGTVAYSGALDNAPLGKVTGERVDYVGNALTAVLAGESVSLAETKPWGCSVKY
jgi:peroxiredoxin